MSVGVMAIWLSVPGATWNEICLMMGMSRWWTRATLSPSEPSMKSR